MLGFGMGRNFDQDASAYHRGNQNTTEIPTHSPVPYLFGGVAAMLALVAVALLILACSFWKLSGHFEQTGHGDGDDGDLDCGEKKEKENGVFTEEESEHKVIVIMAGDDVPTFLAKPAMPGIASVDHMKNVV